MSTGGESSVSLFIYFRARSRDDGSVLLCMARHARALETCGIEMRFWRRADGDSLDHTTWMESCTASSLALESVQSAVAESARSCGLEALAQGPRHIEVFKPVVLPSCA